MPWRNDVHIHCLQLRGNSTANVFWLLLKFYWIGPILHSFFSKLSVNTWVWNNGVKQSYMALMGCFTLLSADCFFCLLLCIFCHIGERDTASQWFCWGVWLWCFYQPASLWPGRILSTFLWITDRISTSLTYYPGSDKKALFSLFSIFPFFGVFKGYTHWTLHFEFSVGFELYWALELTVHLHWLMMTNVYFFLCCS